MKSKKVVIFSLVLMLVTSVNLMAQQQPTVAVRAFKASGGITQDDGNAITDLFISELFGTGKIRVVGRDDFDAIIAEMNFGESSWSNNENVVRMGNAINANYIIQGTVTQLGGRITITVRVLDINKVQYISAPNLQLANMNEIYSKLPNFVKDLVFNFVNNSIEYKVGGLGPSGGYVFIDKGSYTDGWRYIELAPLKAEGIARENNEAVNICRTLNINGLTGWRLPTLDELKTIYRTLKVTGLDTFRCAIGNIAYGYHSSYRSYYGWECLYFNDGDTGQNPLYVRAVRQF